MLGVIFFSVVTFTSAINKTSVSPATSALANAVLSVITAVSVVFAKKTVPVASGSVIVLSAVGSATVSVVSLPSSVAPSKTIVPSSKMLSAEVDVVVALTELNVRVPDSNPLTSVCRLLNCCLKFSSVLV